MKRRVGVFRLFLRFSISPILPFALLLGGCELDAGPSEGRGRLVGRVEIVGSGELMSGVEIRVVGQGDEHDAITVAGTYSVDDLTPGQYLVTVSPPLTYEVAPNTHGTAPVVIVANETKTVNFQLREKPSTSVPPQARN